MENQFESFDPKDTKETKKAVFEKVAGKIKNQGYLFHAQEYDREGRKPKIYHTSEHPRAMEL